MTEQQIVLKRIFSFSIPMLLGYLLAINLIGFIVMFWDKRKAKAGKWRTKEKTLFYITFLGGGIGTTLGMFVFRHKTKKLRFSILFPTITIIEIIFIIYACINYGYWKI